MSDVENAADAAGGEPVVDTKGSSEGDTPQSVREAARALSNWRNRPDAAPPTPPITQAESAPEAEAPPADESAEEADADARPPREEAESEGQGDDSANVQEPEP